MHFRVKQRGASDTKWKHERLTQAVTFFARTLRIPHAKHVDITLKMSAAKLLVEDGTRGLCKATHGNHIKGAPTTFIVTLQRDMPWTWTVTTFAHEMVHVHQFATGRLRYRWDFELGKWLASWENGEWKDKDAIPYRERPWEVEAYAKETDLREAFFKVENPTGTFYY